MRVFLITVLALAACGEVRQVNRWPGHRKEKDEQIEQLMIETRKLDSRVHALEALVAKLRRQASPEPQAPPPAPPPPGS